MIKTLDDLAVYETINMTALLTMCDQLNVPYPEFFREYYNQSYNYTYRNFDKFSNARMEIDRAQYLSNYMSEWLTDRAYYIFKKNRNK